MISYDKILVGVDLSHADRLISEDLSDQCEEAVKKAITLARGGGGTLTFFAAIDISEQAMHLIEVEEGQQKSKVELDAERVLGILVDRARAEGVTADFQVKFGPASTGIIRTAIEDNYSLVVVGRKKRGNIANFFFGRTAIKLLRKCPTPVYIAKPDPERPVESILAADDFSEIGEEILDAAVQTARMFDTRLHVVHVIESGNDEKLMAGSNIDEEELRKLGDEAVEKARSQLTDRLSRTDYRTLTHGTVIHVEKGRPETIIAEKLRENDVDLLVMGTIGRSGLSAMLMGNTAERLLTEMDCSLLAVKPKDFASPIKV